MRRSIVPVVISGVAVIATAVVAGDSNQRAPHKEKDKDKKEETVILSPFEVSAGSGRLGYAATSTIAGSRLGATPGGFQDVNYGRTLLEWGLLPHESEITPEGLFSEYDLPTPEAEKSSRLLSITGDAKVAAILNRPEVTHLAQLGFSSGLDARTWQRDPVFLVVVADVSGSMSGNLPLLKQTVSTMLSRLGPADAFALVSFSDDEQVDQAPARVTNDTALGIAAAIDGLAIRGGTNIEAGLARGFAVAHAAPAGFTGRTRVVLITDAMPNIGATSAGSFMAQAEAASLAGCGLTTIGIGLNFSADFVRRVSAVSGGNAFYFADGAQLQKKIAEDFDFMVTELAFDLEIRVEPARGCRLVDVYGLPGEVYSRTPTGGLLLDLKTLFLSRERGAIFLSFATDASTGAPGAVLGHASLSYTLYGAAAAEESSFDLAMRSEETAGLGLRRGELLINEYEALRAASAAFYEDGNLAAALAQANALSGLFATEPDPALAKERDLLENVASFLALAARSPKPAPDLLKVDPRNSPLVGVWRVTGDEDEAAPGRYLLLTPAGHAVFVDDPAAHDWRALDWKGRQLSADRNTAATLAVKREQLVLRYVDRSSGAKTWPLVRCDSAAAWASTAH